MAKVMLVEDDNNLREIYGARLVAEGYDIVSAADGEEALALAVKERPDLIISDVMMPKISGFDVLDILRTTPETKNTKVIMMTALSQQEDRERSESLGADRYLVKSQVTLEDVVNTVHEVLEDNSDKSELPAAVVAGTEAASPTTTNTPPSPPQTPMTPLTENNAPDPQARAVVSEPPQNKKKTIEPINDMAPPNMEELLKKEQAKSAVPSAVIEPNAPKPETEPEPDLVLPSADESTSDPLPTSTTGDVVLPEPTVASMQETVAEEKDEIAQQIQDFADNALKEPAAQANPAPAATTPGSPVTDPLSATAAAPPDDISTADPVAPTQTDDPNASPIVADPAVPPPPPADPSTPSPAAPQVVVHTDKTAEPDAAAPPAEPAQDENSPKQANPNDIAL